MRRKLFKKALAVATSVLMLSGGLSVQPFADIFKGTAITASAEENIRYIDENGGTQSVNATTLTSTMTDLNNGWYVISEDMTIADRISVSGTVNLILGNGATLTASKGITVGSDAAFNIYAQSDDEATMGALVATAAENSNNAAIGGVNNTNFGTIVINGGKITATTSNGGAGIGGGYGSNGGSITINGGIVSATAGDYSNSAGIGGGNSGYVASVTLNGGIITATGDTHYGGAGIGTGAYAGSGTMTITIGSGVKKLVATKGDDSDCIGKESHANTTVNVVFKNGETTVEGDDKDAVFYDTGEGSVRQIRAKAMNHAVTMSNDLKANITANPEYALAGETVTLTLGAAVDASTLSVNDGTSDLTLTDAGNRQYTFTMPDGDVTVTATAAQSYAVNLPANMEVVSATNAADANGKYISGTVVNFKPMFGYEASDVSDGTNTLEPDANSVYSVTVATADITVTATVGRSATIDLTDASGDFTAINNDVLTGSTAHTVTITDGASITLNNATISGGIVCEGTATINLVGTNSVSGWNGYDSNIGAVHYSAGIQIGGSGTTLTINGDGSLTATGGDGSAGIGLNYAWNVTDDVVGGNIVINGGTITANGGTGGAGIGTSEIKDANNNSSRKAIIGNITITGGTVTAVGGSNADGIGSGKNAYGATIQIGTVTIYDGIDKVDASSIKDFANVVYMHGDDNVTANKTDYFTIGEDGDRRIITKKDDTDYTITIADGIENGTISAVATAKYMQMVTVTATPAFGYRLVRLIVKDGENNDVASTYNTFLMPKGNVTVSAEFALGSHGTTEFTWRYSTGEGPQDQVLETIYDGVTTVNIQQTERSYNILKYENEYNYSKFKLDNNTYEASIPYAGGTGEFYGTGNGTNFRIPNNGETGYYDITLTDAGNSKWYVSFVKTAPKMDVVPDQTYTGSAITPEPLVVAGSLSLTKGTDYEYSYENNTDVGTATVKVTFKGDYESLGYVEKTFNITRKITIADSIEHGTVVADKVGADEGDTVTLTVTPDEGYAVKSVTVMQGETAVDVTENASGTYSFTMPDGDVTVSAEFVEPVTYLDENGVEQTCTDYTLLTGNEPLDQWNNIVLAGGTYVVDGELNYSNRLRFSADNTVLILKDNAKLNISADINAIRSYNMYIYGQKDGTGELNAEANSSCIVASDNLYLYGGNITAYSENIDGIEADNIYLGGAKVNANRYKGAVQVKEGLIYEDEDGNIYDSANNLDTAAIAGKTLAPVKPQSLSSGTIASQPVLHIGNSDNILAVQNTCLDGYKFDGFTVNGEKCENMAAVVTRVTELRDADHSADITITPVFIQNDDTYALTIEGGHIKGSDDTTGEFRVSDQLYAVADAPTAGQKFSCWKVGDTVVGYETTYAFRMPSKAMTLTAVYVADTVEVTKKGAGYIENVYKPEAGKMSFVSILSIPDGCQMLKAGIVAKKSSELGENDLTADNARFVRFTDTSKNSYSSFKYTWTLTPSDADTKWTVRPYLVYKDGDEVKTVYGEAVSKSLNDLT